VRRFSFHWIEPLRRKFAEGMPFDHFSPWRDFVPASICGIRGRISIEWLEPAKPDNPNPSNLTPNGCMQSVVGKVFLLLTPVPEGKDQEINFMREIALQREYFN
jgi:hypothetical protein